MTWLTAGLKELLERGTHLLTAGRVVCVDREGGRLPRCGGAALAGWPGELAPALDRLVEALLRLDPLDQLLHPGIRHAVLLRRLLLRLADQADDDHDDDEDRELHH